MTNQIYIGPGIRGVVKHGSVFSGGLPERLEKLAAAKPIIKDMIVPVEDMVETVRLTRQEGTAAAMAYDHISALSESEIEEIMKGE